MEYVKFSDEAVQEMNDAYQVTNTWPGYRLIGMDGGGRGYFQKKDGSSGVYFLGDMGNINEPKFLCDGEEEIDSSIEALNDLEPVNEKVDVVVFVKKGVIGSIREMQEKFECPVMGVSELLSLVGTELVVVSNVYRSKADVVLARLPHIGTSVRKSRQGE